jgi:hypothetical protein
MITSAGPSSSVLTDWPMASPAKRLSDSAEKLLAYRVVCSEIIIVSPPRVSEPIIDPATSWRSRYLECRKESGYEERGTRNEERGTRNGNEGSRCSSSWAPIPAPSKHAALFAICFGVTL